MYVCKSCMIGHLEAMKEIQQEPRVIPPKVSQEVASPIPEEDVSSNDSIVVGGTLVQRRKGSSIQNSDPSEGETVTNGNNYIPNMDISLLTPLYTLIAYRSSLQ